MKVQLNEKSKAEFIEHIAKDSITCWFDGDEFVMPSGQGRTARGIVLGKLIAWQHQQSKVDDIQKRFDAIKQLINEYHQHSYRESDDYVFYLEQALTGTNHIDKPNETDGE